MVVRVLLHKVMVGDRGGSAADDHTDVGDRGGR